MTDQSKWQESEEYFQLRNAAEMRDDQLSRQMAQTRIASARPNRPPQSMVPFLSRAVLVLAVLLTMRFVVPSILEELQYALTRGQQRARFEAAGEALDTNPLSQLSLASQMVSQRVAPSVVHIEATSERPVPTLDPKSISSQSNREHNQGSGVIVSDDGFIVTNLHVILNTTRIVVTLSDGRQYEASRIGIDELTDLAVLKIDAEELTPATWDDSDQLDEGALVWAVGSPFGFQHSITSGIVSAKNRSSRAGTAYQDFLQTDAAVNPGNSGGPLVNAQGRIIGINTMIVGPAFQGISLAIPSNVARRIYDDLRTNGQVARGWLGIKLAKVTPEIAEDQRLASTNGALVEVVVASAGNTSPAYEAGIRADDVIVKWDGSDVETTEQLFREIAETQIGRIVDLVVVRDGIEENLVVKVGDRPDARVLQSLPLSPRGMRE